MTRFKELFLKAITIGSHSGLSEGKKFALQVTVVDIYWSMLAFLFYTFHTYQNNQTPLFYYHIGSFLVMCLGLWLVFKRQYDLARPIVHLCGLFVIFIAADAYGPDSGVEYYYFTSIMMPHLVYSLEELWKGIWLSAVACSVVIFQQFFGTGLLFESIPVPANEKAIAITIVVTFTLSMLIIARWRLYNAQREIMNQQSHMIHNSNLVALGEMAGGVAHEINNPLQTLALQSQALKVSFANLEKVSPDVSEQLDTVDHSIKRISKLIRALRDLTRDVSNDPAGYFIIREMLDDVLSVSSERLKNLGIQLIIHGDRNLAVNGNMVQISQVLINLLNNSIDALEGRKEKWVTIGLLEKKDRVQVIVTDSGAGIPKEIVKKIMMPFFTTKGAGKGTGLGLSISRSIIEKNGGTLYYDASSTHTRFVIDLPGVTESA